MRKFINVVHSSLCFTTAVLFFVAGICWLFDSRFDNLTLVLKFSMNATIISFLFYILFGGKRK